MLSSEIKILDWIGNFKEMVAQIKVKDNGNLGFIIIPICLFPLFFLAASGIFSLDYLKAFIVIVIIFIIYMVFAVKFLKGQEDVYAIIADENEITIRNIGKYEWREIESIKSERTSLFSYDRNKNKFLNVILNNGKKIRINATNFDYPIEELETIFNSLGNLEN